jgi:hypothetical protein
VEDARLPPPVNHLLLHSVIEFLIRLAAIVMACAAIYLIIQLVLTVRSQRRGNSSAAQRVEQLRKNRRIEVDPPRKPYRPPARPTAPKPATYFTQPTYATNFQRSELETRLLTMLGGQRETAIRLLVSIRTRHPHQDDHWCLEKAIRDLERDRRS